MMGGFLVFPLWKKEILSSSSLVADIPSIQEQSHRPPTKLYNVQLTSSSTISKEKLVFNKYNKFAFTIRKHIHDIEKRIKLSISFEYRYKYCLIPFFYVHRWYSCKNKFVAISLYNIFHYFCFFKLIWNVDWCFGIWLMFWRL